MSDGNAVSISCGVPMEVAFSVGTMRLASPASTLPEPISYRSVTPAAAMASTHSRQRTVPVTCSIRRFLISAGSEIGAADAMAKGAPNAEGERGVIVFTASIAAFDGQIGQAAYSASKGGIVGLTLPVARDLAVVGVRVNTVAPGLIDTPIYGTGEGSEAFKANLTKDVLFPKRLGYPAELASMVVELITNSYMNAQTIRVDAGARLSPK